MQPNPSAKFAYRIRTRHGLVVEHLLIQGRDEADAEKKLRQMYQHCQILECSVRAAAPRKTATTQFKEVAAIAGK
jgi:hypothetical protein